MTPPLTGPPRQRHALFVRVSHWLASLAVFALLLSGVEVMLSHPRFYWGEVGNVNTTPAFTIAVPSSRHSVPTGYAFTLPDANGWSRYLHFQSAWLLLFTGLAYVIFGVRRRHFQRNLVPAPDDRSWRALWRTILAHARFTPGALGDVHSYNMLQRLAYLILLFVLVPLLIWTGLAMAPGFTAVFPATVTLLGGRQSARTLHFIVTIAVLLFTLIHIVMVAVAGFRSRVQAMITGSAERAT